MANTRRYWDGEKWTDHIAPDDTPTQSPGDLRGARHWLGVLAVAAVFGLLGAIIQPDESTGTETAANVIRDGCIGLGVLIGIIGLIGLAANLMRSRP